MQSRSVLKTRRTTSLMRFSVLLMLMGTKTSVLQRVAQATDGTASRDVKTAVAVQLLLLLPDNDSNDCKSGEGSFSR